MASLESRRGEEEVSLAWLAERLREFVDEPTAETLTPDVLDATQGRTVVLITHRLVSLGDVDHVIDLDRAPVSSSPCRTALAGAFGHPGRVSHDVPG